MPVKGLAKPVEVFELIGVTALRQRIQAAVLCQEGWPLRQQDWPFGLQETKIVQRKVFKEEDAGLDNRII